VNTHREKELRSLGYRLKTMLGEFVTQFACREEGIAASISLDTTFKVKEKGGKDICAKPHGIVKDYTLIGYSAHLSD